MAPNLLTKTVGDYLLIDKPTPTPEIYPVVIYCIGQFSIPTPNILKKIILYKL